MSRLTGGGHFEPRNVINKIFSDSSIKVSVSLFMYMVIQSLVKKKYGDDTIRVRSDVKATQENTLHRKPFAMVISFCLEVLFQYGKLRIS